MLPSLSPRAWTYEKAAHLLNRAGFGGAPPEVEALYRLGLRGAVDSLLNAPDDGADFPKPEWAEPQNEVAWRRSQMALGEEERQMRRMARQKEERRQQRDLVAWWMARMQTTRNPLREKMTLFWHSHFATSFNKVNNPYYLWLQNETLRSHALGRFDALTKAILRDPAMLIYLDAGKSRALRPNENFARELMELFTLGIGNYTEADVQEAARAFTGYKVNPANQAFRFSPIQHNDGVKTVLGKTGHFDGDDVIDILLKQRACAPFLSQKLLHFFVMENPRKAMTTAVARELTKSRYDLRATLRVLFLSRAFYEPAAIRTQIKSPVQWMVGTTKVLEVDLPPQGVLFNSLKELGQVPFMPPNVKGWDGGKNWITTSTLLARYNLAGTLVSGPPRRREARERPIRLLLASLPEAAEPEELVRQLALRLFQSPLTPRERAPFVTYLQNHPPGDEAVATVLSLMMCTPQFQLA